MTAGVMRYPRFCIPGNAAAKKVKALAAAACVLEWYENAADGLCRSFV